MKPSTSEQLSRSIEPQPTIPGELDEHFEATTLQGPILQGEPAPLLLLSRRPTLDHAIALAAVLADQLRYRSVLLLRGLGVDGPAAFSRLADAVFDDLPAYHTGEHPLVASETAPVYEPVRFAAGETLLWHHEDSFAQRWPRFLMFACCAPARSGGQTTLVDSRIVYNHMPAELRARLEDTGIRYERLCDGRAGRSWQQIYATSNPHAAQRAAAAREEHLQFTDLGARITAHRPAFVSVGGHRSWFNQILHWHRAALPPDLRDLTVQNVIPAYRGCAFGDGPDIPDSAVDALLGTHRESQILVHWQPGDVLLIDNAVFAHGRQPYTGRRRHLVRMAGIGTYSGDRS